MNKVRLLSILFLTSVNVVLDYFLYLHGWLGYSVVFAVGVLFGLIAGGEMVGDWKAVLYIAFYVAFPLVLVVLVSEDLLPRVRRRLFTNLHGVDTLKVSSEVEEFLRGKVKDKAVFVRAEVRSDDKGRPYLWLCINDEEEFMEREDEIKEFISSRHGVGKDRIAIYWDNQWRY